MSLAVACGETDRRCADGEISSKLREISSLTPGLDRYTRTERLAARLDELGPGCLTEGDVALLSAELRHEDDSVRFWAAAFLGDSGEKAHVAIPALKRSLAERPCEDKVMTSAGAIRMALVKLGETPSLRVPAYCQNRHITLPIPPRNSGDTIPN